MRRVLTLMLSLILFSLVSQEASATTRRTQTTYTSRSQVVPKSTLRLDGGSHWFLPSGQLEAAGGDWTLHPGLTFGFARNWHLGVDLGIGLNRSGTTDPRLHWTYRLTEGGFGAYMYADLTLPFQVGPTATFGVPFYLRLGVLRLETGMLLQFGEAVDGIDLLIPFVVPINITRRFFVGFESGLRIADFDGVTTPIGGLIGYTLTSGGGLLGDLRAQLRRADVSDAGGPWILLLGSELYFDL